MSKLKFVANVRVMLIICASLSVGILSAFCFVMMSEVLFIVSIVMLAILTAVSWVMSLKIFRTKQFIEKNNKKDTSLFFEISKFCLNFRWIMLAVVAFFTFGFCSFCNIFSSRQQNNINSFEMQVKGRVVECVKKGAVTNLILENVQGEYFGETLFFSGNTYGTLFSFLENEQNVEVGNIIEYFCSFSSMPAIKNDGINASAIVNDIKFIAKHKNGAVKIVDVGSRTPIENARKELKDMLEKCVVGETSSVAYALLVGDTDFISGETLSNFRKSGLSHMFAVSGLHIGFIVGVLAWILAKMKQNYIVRIVAISFVLFAYAMLCGFRASIMRAIIMFMCLYLARVFGKQHDAISSLAISFVVVLAINPMFLFDVGFLMSYSVMLSLILLNPVVNKLLLKIKIPKVISKGFATSISAQIGITPVSVSFFQSFSLYSVIANVILIPLISIIFISFVVVIIVVLILPFMAFLFAIPASLLYCVIVSANFVAQLPFSQILIVTFGSLTVFYYLCIVFASNIILLSKKIKVIMICFFAGMFLFSLAIWEIPLPSSDSKIVVLSGYDCEISLITSKYGERILLVQGDYDSSNAVEVCRYFAKNRIKHIDKVFLLNRSIDDYAFQKDEFGKVSDERNSFLKNVASFAKIDKIYLPLLVSDDKYINEDIQQFSIEKNLIKDNQFVAFNGYQMKSYYQSDLKSVSMIEIKLDKTNILILLDNEYLLFEKLVNKSMWLNNYDVIWANKHISNLNNMFRPKAIVSGENIENVQAKNYFSYFRYGVMTLNF